MQLSRKPPDSSSVHFTEIVNSHVYIDSAEKFFTFNLLSASQCFLEIQLQLFWFNNEPVFLLDYFLHLRNSERLFI